MPLPPGMTAARQPLGSKAAGLDGTVIESLHPSLTRRGSVMTLTNEKATIDPERLMAFVHRAVGEIGATLNTALVVMGDGWAITVRWPVATP